MPRFIKSFGKITKKIYDEIYLLLRGFTLSCWRWTKLTSLTITVYCGERNYYLNPRPKKYCSCTQLYRRFKQVWLICEYHLLGFFFSYILKCVRYNLWKLHAYAVNSCVLIITLLYRRGLLSCKNLYLITLYLYIYMYNMFNSIIRQFLKISFLNAEPNLIHSILG